ncbi:MAG: dienelactone hydrolase family protein [Hyphomonadaceae bacterium]|nr:dienelactone hydrolase family protein [Hyphomonadaceae bacterium]
MRQTGEERCVQVVVTNPKDGFALTAYRASAAGMRRGGVVVAQEIFGVTDHIRAICDDFAAHGYDAIAPSLFDRVAPGFHAAHDAAGIQSGLAAVQASPWEQVAGDVQACLDALDGPRYVTGFCYGGAVAWLAAARCTSVAAASGFYGRLINALIAERPKAPMILHYGERDAGIPLSEVDKVREAHPDVTIHLYPAGHGFCRAGSADHHPESAALALQRTRDHFAAHS